MKARNFSLSKMIKLTAFVTKIDEDDYIYISKMIEADPGIVLDKEDEKVFISSFGENSSAEAAGVKAGAELLSIDDVAVKDFELGVNEAVYRLAGRNETTVNIKVIQDGEEKEFELNRIMK